MPWQIGSKNPGIIFNNSATWTLYSHWNKKKKKNNKKKEDSESDQPFARI
jgi:hypothetical protein